MRLLFNTPPLLCRLADDARLGPRARDLIEDPGNDVLVSVVSLWEIVVKVRVGKLEADIRKIADAVEREGFALLDISTAHLRTLAELPMHHRDPFDHLLIAQALAEDTTFLSEDRNAARYQIRLLTYSETPSSPALE